MYYYLLGIAILIILLINYPRSLISKFLREKNNFNDSQIQKNLKRDYQSIRYAKFLWRLRFAKTKIIVYYIYTFRLLEYILRNVTTTDDNEYNLFNSISVIQNKEILTRIEVDLLHNYRKERNKFIHGSYTNELKYKNIEINNIFIILNKIMK